MDRKEHIERLKAIRNYCCAKKDIESLDYAIASLETDEAYQLEYERTTERHKKNVQAYAHDFEVSEEQAEEELRVEDLKDNALDFQAIMINDLWKANTQLKKQIEMLKLDRDCEVDSIPRERIDEMIAEIGGLQCYGDGSYPMNKNVYVDGKKVLEIIHKYTKEQNNEQTI